MRLLGTKIKCNCDGRDREVKQKREDVHQRGGEERKPVPLGTGTFLSAARVLELEV